MFWINLKIVVSGELLFIVLYLSLKIETQGVYREEDKSSNEQGFDPIILFKGFKPELYSLYKNNNKSMLGRGGFGDVYQATLDFQAKLLWKLLTGM